MSKRQQTRKIKATDTFELGSGETLEYILDDSGTEREFTIEGQTVRVSAEGTKRLFLKVTKSDDGKDVIPNDGVLADAVAHAGLTEKIAEYADKAMAFDPEKYKYAKCKNKTELVNAGWDSTIVPENLMGLQDGTQLYFQSKIKSFQTDLPSLTNGTSMFHASTSITSVSSNMPLLTSAQSIFDGCTSLSSIKGDFSSIKNGSLMFWSDRAIKEIDVEFENLSNGNQMFINCSSLSKVTASFHNLSNGNQMFQGCSSLSKITASFHNLSNGNYMFYGCTSLKEVQPQLDNLTVGTGMFRNCALNTKSFNHISNTLPDRSSSPQFSGTICISLGEYEKDAFEKNYAIIANKGWNQSYQFRVKGEFEIPDEIYGENMTYMFAQSKITNVKNDLSLLKNGSYMFQGCTTLTQDNHSYRSLTDGSYMFQNCSSLTKVPGSYPNLTNGTYMFQQCSKLTVENLYLPSLKNGTRMFSNNVTVPSYFNTDLSSLEIGTSMFDYSKGMKEFNSSLKSLTNGSLMFFDITSLTKFTSDLCSLTNGTNMFTRCSLDLESLTNIADTINTYPGTITIGLGHAVGDADIEQVNRITAKGWTVALSGKASGTYSPS